VPANGIIEEVEDFAVHIGKGKIGITVEEESEIESEGR